MSEVAGKLKGGQLLFFCPGCKQGHVVGIAAPAKTIWSFNGDLEKPTLMPSVLAYYGNGKTCHSFVTDGKIRFLADSHHDLKNQTVALPPLHEEPEETRLWRDQLEKD